MKSRTASSAATAAACLLLVSACSSGGESPDDGSSEEQTVTLLTNYFAQAEQGGYWDLETNQYGQDQGVTVDVHQGAPGIATLPQVASGEYDFGVANADDVLMARDSGLPVIALAAPIDKTMFVLMAHASTGITDFDEITDNEIAVRQGVPYWDYIQTTYELDDAEVVSFSGSMAEFKAQPNLIQQGYATADVYLAEDNDIDINVLSVADQAGYNPYSQVLFASERLVQEDPDLVRAVTEATVEGWQHFVEDPADAKESAEAAHSELDPEIFDVSVDELMSGADEWFTEPLGEMTAERWDTLQDQLALIDAVSGDLDTSEMWTNEFLPSGG